MNRVAIFAATSWEMQAVLAVGRRVERTRVAGVPAAMFPCAHAWCYVVHTGVGPRRAGRAAEAVLRDAQWDAAISTGFAGALGRQDIGTVLLGTNVLAVAGVRDDSLLDTGAVCHPALVRAACEAAAALGEAVAVGPMISTDHVVWQAGDKAALACLYDAVGVDMESATLAAIAQRYGVPFLVVRSVSDCVDESLLMDFTLFLRPAHRVSGWLQGLIQYMARPSRWGGLVRLGRQSRVAGEGLARFFGAFLSRLIEGQDLRRESAT